MQKFIVTDLSLQTIEVEAMGFDITPSGALVFRGILEQPCRAFAPGRWWHIEEAPR